MNGQRSYVAWQVAGLALQHVTTDDGPLSSSKAAMWHNQLMQLGFYLPFFCIRDVGLALTTDRSNFSVGSLPVLQDLPGVNTKRRAVGGYHDLIKELATSSHVQRIASMRLRDDMVVALLVKILAEANDRWHQKHHIVDQEILPVGQDTYENVDYASAWRHFGGEQWFSLLEILSDLRLHIMTSIELIDLETIRVIGMFKGESDSFGSAVESVDIVAALDSADAHDVSSFSLDLLPSVLETKRASGVQSMAIDGYASVERKGKLDSLVLSQLAYDDDIFIQKYIEKELLYFGHQRQSDEERRLQYILVDSSPSMRGRRNLFARGLALALMKKMLLLGEEIRFRFFDSRLHPVQKMTRSSEVPVSYLLSFKSGQGRNYGQVFAQLARDCELLRKEQKQQIVLYVFTHGQCHAPKESVAKVVENAGLYTVFILPTTDQLPEFAASSVQTQVIRPEALSTDSSQRARALEIVDDIAKRVEETA